MSDVICDISEWEDYNKDLLFLIEETMPRECKKFMRREGGRLRTVSKQTARSTVNKKTGNYLASIKASKSWRNSRGGYGVYVFTSRPPGFHAHLLEYGHRVYRRGVPTAKRARAFHIMENANRVFESRFWKDCDTFIGQMVDDGMKGK